MRCYCGQPLVGGVHVATLSKWCYPDEPCMLDLAEPEPHIKEE